MNEIRLRSPLVVIIISMFFITSCGGRSSSKTDNIEPTVVEEKGPPIEILQGKVQVGVYYFPNFGPEHSSEWPRIKSALPQFAGHQQPKLPAWGYTNENDPKDMAQKIDAAADHGIDAFIFDWYYYDEGSAASFGESSSWQGNKFLHKALEEGFLKATNNDKLQFSLMWANHDLGPNVKGAVKQETFEALTDYIIETYFKHPSYWKIDGAPYFSIYEFHTFLQIFDNDYAKAAVAIERFRSKVKAAGFPDLHLNGVLWGLKGEVLNNAVQFFNLNSATSYVWIHHFELPSFPSTEYAVAAEGYFNGVASGGANNGLEKPVSNLPIPYHINVSMGWDSSPRCKNSNDWMTRRDYPFGPVIVNNTPYLFKKYLAKAKEWTMTKPQSERIITINSWNEWGEGSYLEPDEVNGMGYLEAVKEVFLSE